MTVRTLVLALLGGLAAAGCGGNEGPTAGELEVRLATPNSDDRAVRFLLGGERTAVTAPAGTNYRVFTAPRSGDTVIVVVVAPQAGHLAAGALVRLSVPDTRQAASYRTTVQDVAATTYAQRAVTGYALTVVKP
jgi:hypothetical protein